MTRQDAKRFVDRKPKVFAAVERGGRVKATVVPSRQGDTLGELAYGHVLDSASVFTDEAPVYDKIGKRFNRHYRIRHRAKVYVEGDVHTQTIEGFFSLLKRGISGVYHSVSTKHLQSYVDEYAFRTTTARRGVAECLPR